MLTFHHANYADAFDQETGLVGWHQRYAQLACGAYAGSIDTLALPGLTIYREQIGVPILQESAGPAGRVLFAIPLGADGSWRVEAGTLASQSMMIAPGGEEVVIVGSEPSDLLIVSADRDLLTVQLPHVDFSVPSHVGRCPQVQGLTDWLLALLDGHANGLAPDNDQYSQVISGLLIDRLVGLANQAGIGGVQGRPDAASIYRRIRDFTEQQDPEPLSVGEIAAGVGVAPVEMRAVFRQVTGLSPSEWIRLKRLDAVRRELNSPAHAGRTVSDVAMTWGFWHLGRFAQYYAARFGETPSETIGRRCRA